MAVRGFHLDTDRSELSSLANDGILPSQQSPRYQVGELGIHRLMEAVLLDAIRCYKLTKAGGHTYDPRTPSRLADDARIWFSSDDRYPFSFLSVCEALEIEPVGFRARLAAGTVKYVRWGR